MYREGQRDFGENYIKELVDKTAQLNEYDDINWHFIGKLQSNKLKQLSSIDKLKSIQSLDSLSHAQKLDTLFNRQIQVFVQLNTSNEPNKGGLYPGSEQLDDLIHFLLQARHLQFTGLMTIGSYSQSTSDSAQNNEFNTLLQTRNHLNHKHNLSLKLSMGMSSDFLQAIDYHSDIVRIGSLLFGARPLKQELYGDKDTADKAPPS
ncbi:hypothetical protein E3P99_01163 [Wallemia hederae]|uniref:Alanine racemase N-terminal domain-containing protein n=1 Tax=Wallemia hederae TaxID=1540922 RepID=A0A4T0FU63_9BASI|nr:hypothetical protein E3P99_01163 [Wallemia hederae]